MRSRSGPRSSSTPTSSGPSTPSRRGPTSALGIVGPGEGLRLAVEGETGPGGRRPVNTDGGLLSHGHALGATGLAQLVELTGQLRQEAAGVQVDGARRALAMSAGGWMGEDDASAVVTVLAQR